MKLSVELVLGSLDISSVRGFSASLYHEWGRGRKPCNPVSILKAQALKQLLCVSDDRIER